MTTTITLDGKDVDVAELEERKSLISHIENYEKHPIVKGVICRETTFRKEIKNFYDLGNNIRLHRYGSCEEHYLKQEDSEKRDKKPSELIEILNEFGDKELDIGKLDYTSVREDCKRWDHPLRKLGKISTFFGGLVLGVGGAVTCLLSAQNGNSDVAIPAGVFGVSGLALNFWSAFKYPAPKGSKDEYGEYRSLLSNAGQADHFILGDYADHIIKKHLDK